jgi:hypothetical protein
MPRVRTIIDDGHEYHPAEYAALWGSGSHPLMYNCGESAGRGRTVANTEWTTGPHGDWADFAREVSDLRAHVAANLGDGWTLEDVECLGQLEDWADEHAEHGPLMYTYCDGESGRELVRMPESVAFGCSGSGSQDANVDQAIAGGSVEWLGSPDDMRRHLKGYGAWDADELADDAANRERVLWLGACDISENPEMYAD